MPAESFNAAAQNPLNDQLIEAISQYGCDRGKVFSLMMRGADTSARGNKPGEEGWTPLMYALTRGNEEALKVLLHYSTNPNVQNDAGDTALMVAVKKNGGFETFRLARQMVREYETDGWIELNTQNKQGETALILAAATGQAEFVERLFDTGADISLRDNLGRNVVHHAAANGHTDVLQRLISRGADFDTTDAQGRTAFTLAAMGGHADCLEMLLAKGADPFMRDKEGKWAMDYARAASDAPGMTGVLETLARLEQEEQQRIADGMPSGRDFSVKKKPLALKK